MFIRILNLYRIISIETILIWSSENSFKGNILDVFEITDLPRQCVENNASNDFPTECPNNANHCFICYDQLDTITKNQIKCVNEKCDALYHMTCICTWLLNYGNTPMFDHLQGKCPQCDEDLLVALENFNLIKSKNTLL